MACLPTLLALASPRVLLVVVWLFTDYLTRPGPAFGWLALGFLLLPATTLTCAVAQHAAAAGHAWGPVAVAAGLLLDLAAYAGGGGHGLRRTAISLAVVWTHGPMEALAMLALLLRVSWAAGGDLEASVVRRHPPPRPGPPPTVLPSMGSGVRMLLGPACLALGTGLVLLAISLAVRGQ